MRTGRLAAALLAATLAVVVWAGCATHTNDRRAEVVVGSLPDAESMLLAGIYVAALR